MLKEIMRNEFLFKDAFEKFCDDNCFVFRSVKEKVEFIYRCIRKCDFQNISETSNHEILMNIVQNEGLAIRHIPGKLLDREVVLAAVNNDGLALEFVPEVYRDREVCMAAVTQNGHALPGVPHGLRDREMCMTTVAGDGQALIHVPRETMDYNLCLAAVSNDCSALLHVPICFLDRNLFLAAASTAKKDDLDMLKSRLKFHFSQRLYDEFMDCVAEVQEVRHTEYNSHGMRM